MQNTPLPPELDFLWRTLCGGLMCGNSGVDPGFGQVADKAKQSHTSDGSSVWPGSRPLEAFGFLMLKYAFSHILETLFL